MTIDEIVQQDWQWLQGGDADGAIVVSTRVRLARNLAEHTFVSQLSEQDRTLVERKLITAIQKTPKGRHFTRLDVGGMDELEQAMLVESHLASPELIKETGAHSVMISPDGRTSLMLLEEDHLRIQMLSGGFNLQETWQEIDALDDQLEQHMVYAWDEHYGYLTACPTNVGTGMRVSVMLHLPALVATRQFARMYQSLQKVSLTVRGTYGEGTQAFGNFYQISNQTTLGISEPEILQQVHDVIQSVINYELRARKFLLEEGRDSLIEDIQKNLDTLRTASSLSMEETMHCLSIVRLGIALDLLPGIPMETINQLLIRTQPAHIQWIYGGVISSLDTNVLRSQFLQRYLSKF